MAPRLPLVVALLAALALLLAVGWWFVSQQPPSLAAPSRAESADAHRAPEAANAPAPAISPADRAAVARVPESAPAPDAAAPPLLHGTIVGVGADEQEREFPALDGRFTLHLRRGEKFEQHEVAVVAGRWSSDVARVDAIGVSGVVLDEQIGRGILDLVPVPPSGRLALRVELVPPSLLRVLDAATRAPLDGVDLFLDVDEPPVDRLYPIQDVTARAPLVASARSPVRFPAIDGQPIAWLHVSGYAWTRVQLQQLVGGEREVPLERGGTLEIAIARLPADARFELVVARVVEADRLTWNAPLTAGRESPVVAAPRLADLAPGAVEIELRAGAQLVAATRAEVRAGETTRVELTVEPFVPSPEVARVPFRGTVTGVAASIAAARAVELFALPNEPAADPAGAEPANDSASAATRLAPPPRRELARDPARPAAAAFDFGDLAPGRYVVTVAPLQIHQLFELGAAGITDAVIELPPLCDVEVEVVDAHTGERLADGAISWRTADFPPPAPPARNFMLRVNAPAPDSADAAAKVTRFGAPPGRIVVQAWPDRYGLAKQELELRPGRNRATLSVTREQYVRILVKDGAANVPINPAELPFDVVRADGTSAQVGWAKEVATGALLLIVAEPGDYTLTAPRVSGFAAIPARPVHVEYGGTTDVVIDLARE